jgi:carbonic anhydrase
MRLFEAIVDANHRAVAGDKEAGLHPADFAEELPVIALTCVDPRLNAYFPNALALPAEKFIWLRNAGNIITGPMSSTMRSLALACAVKGGREIAIIGHSDCQIAKTTTMQLLEKLKAVGVDRHMLPDNLSDFFGMFGSERQNVIKACDIVRHSPLIGPNIPAHGFLLDLGTGKLDWIVNGYEELKSAAQKPQIHVGSTGMPGGLNKFEFGEMKFPETKIGELVAKTHSVISNEAAQLGSKVDEEVQTAVPMIGSMSGAVKHVPDYDSTNAPPKIPIPPPIPRRFRVKR